MIYKIEYHKIQSDHILATPTFHHEEFVTAETLSDIFKYIKNQKDDYGNNYRRCSFKEYNFDFISNVGGVKLLRVNLKKI